MAPSHAPTLARVAFDVATVKTERIKEDADYEGVRVRFVGHLGKARAAMQIDVGFGDVVTPGAETITTQRCSNSPRPSSRAIRGRRWWPRSSRRWSIYARRIAE
jgi:nucleotidyltransferase AbiEii toxin of type IV toxin-antitoxin system